MDTENTNSFSEVLDVDTAADKELSLAEDTLSKEIVQTSGTVTALDTSTTGRSGPVNTNSNNQPRGIIKRRKTDEFLKFLKERHENRQLQLQAATTSQQPMDEISSFSKNIEMSLRKLSARSRSLAKSEIFSIISKYELMDIDGENSRSCYSSSLSNTTPFSPISMASPISTSPTPQHEHQTTLLDLSSTPHQISSVPQQLEYISTEIETVLNDQLHSNLSPTSQKFL